MSPQTDAERERLLGLARAAEKIPTPGRTADEAVLEAFERLYFLPYSSTIQEGAKVKRGFELASKIGRGEELSREEKEWARRWQVEQERIANQTGGSLFWDSLLRMPAWAGEFATGGLLTKGTVKVAKGGLRRIAGEELKKNLSKAVQTRAGRVLSGKVAQFSGMAAGRTVADEYVPRAFGQTGAVRAETYRALLNRSGFRVTEDEAGEVQVTIESSLDSFAAALPSGMASVLIKNAAEDIGGTLIGGKPIKDAGSNALRSMAIKVYNKLLAEHGGDVGKVTKLFRKTGWSRIVPEFIEERADDIMRAAAEQVPGIEGIGPSREQIMSDPWSIFPGGRELMIEMAVLGTYGTGIRGLQAMENMLNSKSAATLEEREAILRIMEERALEEAEAQGMVQEPAGEGPEPETATQLETLAEREGEGAVAGPAGIPAAEEQVAERRVAERREIEEGPPEGVERREGERRMQVEEELPDVAEVAGELREFGQERLLPTEEETERVAARIAELEAEGVSPEEALDRAVSEVARDVEAEQQQLRGETLAKLSPEEFERLTGEQRPPEEEGAIPIGAKGGEVEPRVEAIRAELEASLEIASRGPKGEPLKTAEVDEIITEVDNRALELEEKGFTPEIAGRLAARQWEQQQATFEADRQRKERMAEIEDPPSVLEQSRTTPPIDKLASPTAAISEQAKEWRRTPIGERLKTAEPEPGEKIKPISAPQVIKAFADVAPTVPIREGVMARKVPRGVSGFFVTRPETIHIQSANNIGTAAHEVAHAFDWTNWRTPRAKIAAEKAGKKTAPPWFSAGVDPAIKMNEAEIAELEKLGQDLYGEGHEQEFYRREGWAETVRIWSTEPDQLEGSPALARWFETKFKQNYADAYGRMTKARDATMRWIKQSPMDRAKQSMVTPTVFTAPMKAVRGIRRFFSPQAFYEDGHELFKLAQVAKGAGVKLKAHEDPFEIKSALQLTHVSRMRRMIEKNMVDISGNVRPDIPSLRQAVAPMKKNYTDFSLYLWAKRAGALWETGRNPGLSRADAAAVMVELEEKHGQRIRTAAENVYKWWDGIMDYVASASPDLARVVARIRRGDVGSYVPLFREFRELDERWKSHRKDVGGGSATRADVSKFLKGSGRRVQNPLASLVQLGEQHLLMAHQRAVLDAAMKLANVPGAGHIIEQVPREHYPALTRRLEDVVKAVQKKLSDVAPGAIDVTLSPEFLEGLGLDPNTKEADEAMREILESVGEMMTFFAVRPIPKSGDLRPIVPIWQNGKPKWYYVNENIYGTLEGMDLATLPLWAEMIFGLPKRWFTLGTTGMRASFGLVTNPLRDPQTMALTSQSNAGLVRMGLEITKRYFQALVTTSTTGKVGSDPWLEYFQNTGGEIARTLGQDSYRASKAAAREFQGRRIVYLNPNNWWQFLADLFQAPESAPRVAELKLVANEMGIKLNEDGTMPHITLEQSIQLINAYKRVTVDFTAAGEVSRVLNRVMPFHNAAIQGTRAFLRAAKHHPGRFALRAGGMGLIASTLALWWSYRDEEWWREMPLREKFMFWHFPVKIGDEEVLIRLPRAHESGMIFAALPELFADSWYHNDPEAAGEWFSLLFDVLNPYNYPVLGRTIIEQAANYDLFWERPIVPRAEQDLPAEEQYNEFTSELAKFVGKMTGTSPMRWQHGFRSVFGGGPGELVSLPTDLAEIAGWIEPARENELADAPIIGRLFQRGGKLGTRTRAIGRMYDLLEEARKKQKSRKHQETPLERQQRLMLTDAANAVSAAGYLRALAPSLKERNQLASHAHFLARMAVSLMEPGWLTEADRAFLKSEAKRLGGLKQARKALIK